LHSDDTAGIDRDAGAERDARQPSPDRPALDHAGWRVIEFQEEGIAYFVVQDDAGRAQVTIGSAGGVFWAVPAAGALAKVSLPSWPLRISPDALPTQVHASADFTLMLFDHGGDAVWSVEFRRAPAGLRASR
jgi:hypothetical protein